MTLLGKIRRAHAPVLIAALLLLAFIAWVTLRWTDIQFELGYAYEHGALPGLDHGFASDYPKAAYWLRQAAQTNHPRAQYRLGILYAHGWGVPRDEARALQWFTRSAQNGYAPARYHLGWMYHKDDGVARDDDRAIRLLEQAGGQGMAAAPLALGKFYEHGEGVPADAVLALKWYVLAEHFARSRPGLFDNAAFAVRAQAARDALASQLPPSSIERAQAFAKEWLAQRARK